MSAARRIPAWLRVVLDIAAHYMPAVAGMKLRYTVPLERPDMPRADELEVEITMRTRFRSGDRSPDVALERPGAIGERAPATGPGRTVISTEPAAEHIRNAMQIVRTWPIESFPPELYNRLSAALYELEGGR